MGGSFEEEVGQAGLGKVGWGAGRGLKAELAGAGRGPSLFISLHVPGVWWVAGT